MRRAALALGFCWALPTTLVGLLLAVLGCAEPYKLRPYGVWQWVASDGPWDWFFRKSGMGALTIGSITIFTPAIKDDVTVLRHESIHTCQAYVLGVLFIPVYYLLALEPLLRGKDAYRTDALEVEAYDGQDGK